MRRGAGMCGTGGSGGAATSSVLAAWAGVGHGEHRGMRRQACNMGDPGATVWAARARAVRRALARVRWTALALQAARVVLEARAG